MQDFGSAVMTNEILSSRKRLRPSINSGSICRLEDEKFTVSGQNSDHGRISGEVALNRLSRISAELALNRFSRISGKIALNRFSRGDSNGD